MNIVRSRWNVILFSMVLILLPFFVTSSYIMHLIVLTLIYAVLASSLNLLTGYSGLLSLGHQAFFGIGAYVSALLAVDLGVPFIFCFLIGGFVAMFAAWFIGKITLRLRSSYFVIATIAFAEILRIVSVNWVEVTRGPMGVVNIPSPSLPIPFIGTLQLNTPYKAYFFILALSMFSYFIVYRVINSTIGRALIAVKDAEPVALSVGINVPKYLMNTLLISAFMAGSAGSFFAHYMRFLSPDIFYFTVSITIIIMIVGGGLGTLLGPFVGAAIFTILPETLRFSAQYRLILYGLLLILIIRFLPGGAVGLSKFTKQALRKTRKQNAAEGE